MNAHEKDTGPEAVREGVSSLSAAILRINASLDVDTALGEALDSARALTGADYGVIATVDEGGRPEDVLTAGFTEDEDRRMRAWPDGPALFEHLRGLAAPLRLPDLDAWIRSLGCSAFPVPGGTFQATPMRHRDADVGGLFLGGKAGGFTAGDEQMLTLFASQVLSLGLFRQVFL